MRIIRHEIKQGKLPELSDEQIAELKALASKPDSEIDYSDIPEVTDFSGWVRGKPLDVIRQARFSDDKV